MEEKAFKRLMKRYGVGSDETISQTLDRLIKAERKKLGLSAKSPRARAEKKPNDNGTANH